MKQRCISYALGVAWALCAGHALSKDLTLAISEGSSGGTDHARVIAKYQGLADALGSSLKKKVNVVFIREFSALEDGLKNKRFAMAMARPSDYPARGLRDHGYQYVASARPDGHCLIIVPQDASHKTLADIKGQRIVLPSPAAYMTKFCTAELRDNGIDLSKERGERVREQDSVPLYLSHKLADVGGVASYSGAAKKLEQSGHRVLHKSVAQPYFPLIADASFTEVQIRAMQAALMALPDSAPGRDVLKRVGVQGFDTAGEARLRALLPWLGL